MKDKIIKGIEKTSPLHPDQLVRINPNAKIPHHDIYCTMGWPNTIEGVEYITLFPIGGGSIKVMPVTDLEPVEKDV